MKDYFEDFTFLAVLIAMTVGLLSIIVGYVGLLS